QGLRHGKLAISSQQSRQKRLSLSGLEILHGRLHIVEAFAESPTLSSGRWRARSEKHFIQIDSKTLDLRQKWTPQLHVSGRPTCGARIEAADAVLGPARQLDTIVRGWLAKDVDRIFSIAELGQFAPEQAAIQHDAFVRTSGLLLTAIMNA